MLVIDVPHPSPLTRIASTMLRIVEGDFTSSLKGRGAVKSGKL